MVSAALLKLGIVAGHIAFQPVRLQASLFPDAMHGVLTDIQRRASLRQLQCVEPLIGFLREAAKMRARRAGQHACGLSRMECV